MEKGNLDILKKTRDRLSFVIFSLTAKAEHNLKFSDDEAQGFRDILSQISDDLIKISRSYEETTPLEEKVQEHISSMEKEFPGESIE